MPLGFDHGTMAGKRWARRIAARARRRRADLIVGGAAALSAALALPFTTSPEAAAVLAVAATALLAGQRWALGVVVVAELALLRSQLALTLAPPAEANLPALWLGALAAAPVLGSTRRGAAALALLVRGRRTRATCRLAHAGLLVLALACGCSPLW